MRIIETKFILKKTIEIKELGIKFRRIKSNEKDQIINDLREHYYNNIFLEQAKKYDLKTDGMSIKKVNFWNSLDELNKSICLFNNLLNENEFRRLSFEEMVDKVNHMVIIECDESILAEYIDEDKITKFISNLLSLYEIYASPLAPDKNVKLDYSFILESDLLERNRENYYEDLILNCAMIYILNNNVDTLRYVNISQKYLQDLQKLFICFNKSEVRTFVSSIDLLFVESASTENRIINLTSVIEKLLISSDENIQKEFILKAGLILKKYLKSKNEQSNIAIKNLLSFSYNIRSCIVHGNSDKIIDSLSKLTQKDKKMLKLCNSKDNKYNSKIKDAYQISQIILYLTLRSIIKYWFDYPSELKYIKNN